MRVLHPATDSSAAPPANGEANDARLAHAKRSLKAAASPPRGRSRRDERFDWTDPGSWINYAKAHPAAAASVVLAAATVVGPGRLVRLGIKGFRMFAVAKGLRKTLG